MCLQQRRAVPLLPGNRILGGKVILEDEWARRGARAPGDVTAHNGLPEHAWDDTLGHLVFPRGDFKGIVRHSQCWCCRSATR